MSSPSHRTLLRLRRLLASSTADGTTTSATTTTTWIPDPACLSRFLIANDFNEDKTAKALARHANWLSLHPYTRAGGEMVDELDLAWIVDGTKFLVWCTVDIDKIEMFDRNASWICESLLTRMSETRHTGGMSVIVDVSKISLGQIVAGPVVTNFHNLVKTLTNNYPELVKEIFVLVNAPATGSTLVDLMVSLLPGKLPTRTMGKIIVIHHGLDELVSLHNCSREVLQSWWSHVPTDTSRRRRQFPLNHSFVSPPIPPPSDANNANHVIVDALADSLRLLLTKCEDIERETLMENQRLRRLLATTTTSNHSGNANSSYTTQLAELEDEIAGLQRSVDFARNFINMQDDTIVRESRQLEREVQAVSRENLLLKRELEAAFGQNAPTYFLDDFTRV